MAEEMNPTAVELDPAVEERVHGLIEKGRPAECVDLSDVESLVEEMNLSDEEAEFIHERIEAAGIAVADDCGHRQAENAGYRNGELAEQTTDALQLFFNEMRRYPLLTKDAEIELAQAVDAIAIRLEVERNGADQARRGRREVQRERAGAERCDVADGAARRHAAGRANHGRDQVLRIAVVRIGVGDREQLRAGVADMHLIE